jgi:hypothetical protein
VLPRIRSAAAWLLLPLPEFEGLLLSLLNKRKTSSNTPHAATVPPHRPLEHAMECVQHDPEEAAMEDEGFVLAYVLSRLKDVALEDVNIGFSKPSCWLTAAVEVGACPVILDPILSFSLILSSQFSVLFSQNLIELTRTSNKLHSKCQISGRKRAERTNTAPRVL